MKALLLACVATCFTLPAVASGDTVDELIEQLRAGIQAELKAVREKGDDVRGTSTYRLQDYLLRLRPNDSERPGFDLVTLAQQIEAISTDEKVRKTAATLAVTARAEREKKEAEFLAEMESGVAKAFRQAMDGKSAKDIDAPLEALAKYGSASSPDGVRSPKLQLMAQNVTQAQNFVRQWQDYLSQKEAGKLDVAANTLKQLTQSHREFGTFVARSELLAMFHELDAEAKKAAPEGTSAMNWDNYQASVTAIVDKVSGLEGIGAAMREIDELRSKLARGTRGYPDAAEGLRRLSNQYEALKRGDASFWTASDFRQSSSGESTSLHALRDQLVRIALPRILGLPNEAKVEQGEGALKFLQRTLESARQAKDWNLVGRVLDLMQSLQWMTATTGGDRVALSDYLAGTNHFRAKQYLLAVQSYLKALESGSQIVPAEEIGEKLAEIRSNHPADYDQGMALILGRSLSSLDSGRGAVQRTFRPPQPRNELPQVLENENILVPAVKPTPAPPAGVPEKKDAAPSSPTPEKTAPEKKDATPPAPPAEKKEN